VFGCSLRACGLQRKKIRSISCFSVNVRETLLSLVPVSPTTCCSCVSRVFTGKRLNFSCVPGRGRAKDSKVYVLAYADRNFIAKERANAARNKLTERCLRRLREMDPGDLSQQVNEFFAFRLHARTFVIQGSASGASGDSTNAFYIHSLSNCCLPFLNGK